MASSRSTRLSLVSSVYHLLAAPSIFGVEIGFNLPAFLIALVITAILVVGIKESAQFNAAIVVVKVAVVLFVIGLGATYVNRANWGSDWVTSLLCFFFRESALNAYIFFALHRLRRRLHHGPPGSTEP